MTLILVCSYQFEWGTDESKSAYEGANPSAEEADEALEEGATQINNVVYSFRLQSTQFDKKSYLTYLKVRFFFCPPLPDGSHLCLISVATKGLHEERQGEALGDQPY